MSQKKRLKKSATQANLNDSVSLGLLMVAVRQLGGTLRVTVDEFNEVADRGSLYRTVDEKTGDALVLLNFTGPTKAPGPLKRLKAWIKRPR